MIKYGVKEEILFFSDGSEILFYSIKELDWTDDENFDEIDQLFDGVYFYGDFLDYNNLLMRIEDETGAEHIDSSDENILIFDSFEEAKIKFENLVDSKK